MSTRPYTPGTLTLMLAPTDTWAWAAPPARATRAARAMWIFFMVVILFGSARRFRQACRFNVMRGRGVDGRDVIDLYKVDRSRHSDPEHPRLKGPDQDRA